MRYTACTAAFVSIAPSPPRLRARRSDIKLSGVALSGVSATLSPGVGIVASVGSLNCIVNADFYVRSDVWPNPSGSGAAVVTVSGATAALTVEVGTDALHVALSAEGVSASAGALDIQLSGAQAGGWVVGEMVCKCCRATRGLLL